MRIKREMLAHFNAQLRKVAEDAGGRKIKSEFGRLDKDKISKLKKGEKPKKG